MRLHKLGLPGGLAFAVRCASFAGLFQSRENDHKYVTLNGVKGLGMRREILRFAQNDN